MIEIPLSQIGSPAAFAKEIEDHRAALIAHQKSENVPVPVTSPLVEAVIARQPQSGPIAERGPDDFIVLPYKVLDDTPKTPEAAQAVKVLRETIGAKA